MNKKILTALVKKEASKLKRLATRDEISRLDFGDLEANCATQCIYGQATGSCFSPRANRLIESCAQRVYTHAGISFDYAMLAGKPKLDERSNRSGVFWSPIEVFIGLEGNDKNGNNKILVDYLKGKTKGLSFKKF